MRRLGFANPARQPEEFRDVIGRGDAGLEHERALPAVTPVIFGAPERPPGLSSTEILAVLAARDGSVWTGYLDGGADRIDPASGRIEAFRPNPKRAGALPPDAVLALAEGDDGTIYFGTRRGIYAGRPGAASVRRLAIAGRHPAESTAVLAFDAGLLWIGTMMAQIWAKGFREHIMRRLLCLSVFWHALDIIWVAIFTIVYLIGTLP